MADIRKVGVLGSGVMGSGIAAHVANAGVPVVLLDIVPEGANDRNLLAAGAIARMVQTKPAPLRRRLIRRLGLAQRRLGGYRDHRVYGVVMGGDRIQAGLGRVL